MEQAESKEELYRRLGVRVVDMPPARVSEPYGPEAALCRADEDEPGAMSRFGDGFLKVCKIALIVTGVGLILLIIAAADTAASGMMCNARRR